MKFKKIILVTACIYSFICFGQNGIYFTKEAFDKDSISPGYTLISWQQKNSISFGHSGQVVTLKLNELYAYTDKNGELVRVYPKEGPQKIFIEGSICLYAHPLHRFEGRGGPCPEFTTKMPNMEFYISSTRKGELLVATPKNLKKLIGDDLEIFEAYKRNKNIAEAVCTYNKKHPTPSDKFYYRGK